MPHLARITLYPIKSLDGHAVASAEVLPNGALRNDRRFAIVESGGLWVNGKREPRLHGIRATYDLSRETVTLRADLPTDERPARTFRLAADDRELAEWLGLFLGRPVTLQENETGGFPDDSAAPGPTVIATETLEAVANWFPGLTVDEVRRRFRANLEIGGLEPFGDDRLFDVSANDAATSGIRIGAVTWLGTNPCQRCVVPSRSSTTGEPTARFQSEFCRRREETLPPWSPRERFDHYYRLAVNTRLHPNSARDLVAPAMIRTGERVEILGRHEATNGSRDV